MSSVLYCCFVLVAASLTLMSVAIFHAVAVSDVLSLLLVVVIVVVAVPADRRY